MFTDNYRNQQSLTISCRSQLATFALVNVEERLMICLFHDLLNLVSFPNPNY